MDTFSRSPRLIALFLTLFMLGCNGSNEPVANTEEASSAGNTTPAFGDRLVDASIGDASNLIPMIASDAASHAVAGQMYLSLLKYDKNLKLIGQLASGWEISPDNKTITFHIKPGIHWTDGKPLTAQDCAFTLNLMLDEKTQSAYKSDYELIESSSAPDAATFIVRYKEAYSPALASWASLAIMPEHVFKGVDIMNTPLSRKPSATVGPYVLADWQAQQSILMRANPDYFDGKVWIAERMTRIIPDPATQFLELTAGSIDTMGLTPIQYQRLFDNKRELKAHYRKYQYLNFVYTYMGFNLKRPMFADIRVRQAIAHAIDRQELVDGVLLGLGEVLDTPYKPGTPWVNKNIKPWSYNIELSKKFLADAGWKDSDGDGILDKDGKPFRFTVLTNNGNKARADTATIMQQRLRQAGIDMKVRLVEWSAFIENFINKRNFDAVILGWSLTPEPDQYNIWHSSQTGARQFNFLSYSSPVVDEALEKARRTFDEAERKQLYDRMQEAIHQDVPMVFLYAPYSLPVFHKRIHGIEPAPAGIGWNSEYWYVPEDLQKYQVSQSIQP